MTAHTKPKAGRVRRFRRLGRFGRNRDGATLVEFAFLAAPFVLMIFGLLEVAFLFFISTTLENATEEAARLVRTGQMQLSGASADDFKQAVCDGIVVLTPCDGALFVDVRVYSDFGSVTNPSPVSGGEFDESGVQVDFGDAGDIVVVRVYYIWHVFTPGLGTGMANLNGGRRLITASAAFRNEPYS